MRGTGCLILPLTIIGYSKCETSYEGNCGYACNPDGSCRTNWIGSFRPGGTEASCFSPQFGGNCFGTVNGCKDCNKICGGGSGSSKGGSSGRRPSGGNSCSGSWPAGASRSECNCSSRKCDWACVGFAQENGGSSGNSCSGSWPAGASRCECDCSSGKCDWACVGFAQENGGSSGSSSSSRPSGGSSSSGGSNRKCSYECQSNGGCRVSHGLTSGSCFPASFGGSCSGTPRECKDCNRALNC